MPADTGARLPIYDLQSYLNGDKAGTEELAEGLAASLHLAGACVVRDPRVLPSDQSDFLDMMERYYEQSTEVKLRDTRPSMNYQVGVTPEGVEVPKAAHDAAMQAAIRSQPVGRRAASVVTGGGADPRWRFSARIGPPPPATQYMEPVIPEGFFDWEKVTKGWGGKMLATASAVAELAAQGLDLPHTSFTELMAFGPHLLAPTGTNLQKHGQAGRVIAGSHSDQNFLTIHGKSRYPGLHIWLRNGTRIPVLIPDGCLLVQAGKQLEWLTGGYVQAGMHEVVSTYATAAAVDTARQAGRSMWRVSSTVFGHIASDQVLKPIGRFGTAATRAQYPPVIAGDFTQQKL